jgi:hypothetical protein
MAYSPLRIHPSKSIGWSRTTRLQGDDFSSATLQQYRKIPIQTAAVLGSNMT